jgi:hypothetical protein
LILSPERCQSIWTYYGGQVAATSSQSDWIKHCYRKSSTLQFFLFEIEIFANQCRLCHVSERGMTCSRKSGHIIVSRIIWVNPDHIIGFLAEINPGFGWEWLLPNSEMLFEMTICAEHQFVPAVSDDAPAIVDLVTIYFGATSSRNW